MELVFLREDEVTEFCKK